MNRQAILTSSLLLAATLTANAGTTLLYDFEGGTEGWDSEWGLKQAPTNSSKYSRHGDESLKLTHEFTKKDYTIGVRILFDNPRDFLSETGFAGFSAWVYFPSSDGWEAQFYTHNGDGWKWANGKLYNQLQPGWHQIFLRPEDIAGARELRDLGIQFKNFKVKGDASIYVDRIEALYTDTKTPITDTPTNKPLPNLSKRPLNLRQNSAQRCLHR